MKAYEYYYETPERNWPISSRCIYNFIGFMIYILAKVLFRTSFENARSYLQAQKMRKREKKSGTVLICNHVSVVEPPVLVAFAWAHKFRLRPLYKIELEKNRFFKWLFCRMGGIPVQRGQEDLKLVRHCTRLLAKGDSLLIFPEGTRVKEEDSQQSFHRGFSLIAHVAKTDVYPVAVVGALQILPKGAWFPHFHKVRFLFGDKLSFLTFSGLNKKEKLLAMSKAGEKAVFSLRNELRSRYPNCR